MKRILSGIILIPVLLSFLFSSCEELTPLGDFIYDKLALPTPAITSDADVNGYSNDDITITLTPPDSHPDAVIRYSVDRSDPADGTVYTNPFVIGGHNTPILIKTVAQKPLYIDSDVAQEEYLILYDSAGPPILSPAPGSYNLDQEIMLSSTSSGAAIWYTSDGTDPRNSATRVLYSGAPILIGDDGTSDGAQLVINAVSQVTGLPDSPLVSGSYTVLYDALSPPVFTPASAQSLDPVSVSMSSPDGTPIWYTSNGASPLQTVGGLELPSSSATLYTGPITINWSGYDSRTLKAASVDVQKRASSVQIGSYFYQIAQTAAPSGEIYNGADSQTVYFDGNAYLTNLTTPRMRLISGDSDTSYFYTTDGSMPQIDVNTGSGTISILNPNTHEFDYDASVGLSTPAEGTYNVNLLAVQDGLEASSLVQVQVDIDLTAPTPPGLSNSIAAGSDGNLYINQVDLASGGWTVGVSSTAMDGTGAFQWKFSSDITWNDVSGSTIPAMTISPDFGGDGSYFLEARESDTAGNISAPATMNMLVDTVAPAMVGPGNIPLNQSSGHELHPDGVYWMDFTESIDPGTTEMGLFLNGTTEVSSPDVAGNHVALSVPSPLTLDGNYTFSLTSVSDMAGNSSSPGWTREFTTGAIFWSIGGNMYKSPISPRPGWTNSGAVLWIDDSTPITDIEISGRDVIWSIDDGGGSRIHSTPADQYPAASWAQVDTILLTSSMVQDIEVWDADSTIFFATRDDPTSTIRGTDLSGSTTWQVIANIDDSTHPYGLAGDADGDLYWANSSFTSIWATHSASWTPPMGVTSSPLPGGLAVRYPAPGSLHHLYGLINMTYGGVAVPPSANATTYIQRRDLNHNWTSSYTEEDSRTITLADGALWGNGISYGGDIAVVETNGVNAIFAIGPTITGVAAPGAQNEYGAVFRTDFDLTTDTKLYDPFELGLFSSWHEEYRGFGAIAVLTE